MNDFIAIIHLWKYQSLLYLRPSKLAVDSLNRQVMVFGLCGKVAGSSDLLKE